MISFLSTGMALFLVKKGIIDDETCEVCQYAEAINSPLTIPIRRTRKAPSPVDTIISNP